MVKIPRKGTEPPPVTITVEAPMASIDAITVTIQQNNQPQSLPSHPNRQTTIHALSTNAGTVYIGGGTVNANAFPLNPGAAQDTHVDDLSKVWVFGTKGDQVTLEIEWGVGEL